MPAKKKAKKKQPGVIPGLPMPVYVRVPKSNNAAFLREMNRRMMDHSSMRLEGDDIAVCVVTAAELQRLIEMAEGKR